MKKNLMFLILHFFIVGNGVCQQAEFVPNFGHTDEVIFACYTPDNKCFLTASIDKYIKLWDVKTGRCIKNYVGHTKDIICVAISNDGKYILSGSDDSKAKLWDLVSGKCVKTFEHTGSVRAVAFSSDRKICATAASVYDNPAEIKIWNLETGDCIHTLTDNVSKVKALAFSNDNRFLISGGGVEYRSSELKIWNVSTGYCKITLKENKKDVVSLCFSSDGNYFFSTSYSDIVLWDYINLKPINKFTEDGTNSIKFSPDNKTFLTGGNDKNIELRDIKTGKIIREYAGHSSIVRSASFSNDGKQILSASSDKKVIIWNTETAQILRSFEGRNANVSVVEYSPDGKTFLTADWDKKIRIWDALTGKLIKVFPAHTELIYTACFSPDGKYILSSGWDEKVMLWDVQTGRWFQTLDDYCKASCVAFSPDGKLIAYCTNFGNTVCIVELKSLKKTYLIDGDKKGSAYTVCFSPDGKYLASGYGDNQIKIWNTSTLRCEKTINTQIPLVRTLCYTPNGQRVLAGGNYSPKSPNLELLNVTTGLSEKLFEGHNESILLVDVSKNGKYAISGCWDNTVRLWDIQTGKCIRTYFGHTDHVQSVSFAPDCKHFISGSWDNTVKLWEINQEEEILSMISYENEWIISTPDGYWDGSVNCGNMVSIVNGLKFWNIDQFATKNNRPDIILPKIGNNEDGIVNHYYAQYKKRLKKQNLTDEILEMGTHLPQSEIINTDLKKNIVNIKAFFSDSICSLRSYNVFVNNVPLFNSLEGNQISGKEKKISEKIYLTFGINKIEVSCTNEKGVESLRDFIEVASNEKVKSNLHFLAFGVSKYQNPAYNLQYADKDATDLEKVIQSFKGKGFENVYTKVLTNEEVTPDAIKASKTFVANAKPDDTFILFIAGHGMHDKDAEATYYFLTSNADVNNLKGTAADFETIEDLLQGIPPRNKLFLMDACESGEIDEEVQGQMLATATGAGINSRGFKKTETQTSVSSVPSVVTKRSYLYQKDRYIYNDLVRRSGAIVFSSSKGGELSYERSDIENGLFTEYIMKALTTTEADKDNNGIVSTDELREYVTAQVAKASGDLQHPTVDRDNIYQKFGFNLK